MIRLIDSDEMKIKGYMRLSGYTVTNRLIDAVVDSVQTVKAIPVPDNATNGDVIKAMFPNIITDEFAITIHATTEVVSNGVNGSISYDFWKDWWNEPYKMGDAE